MKNDYITGGNVCSILREIWNCDQIQWLLGIMRTGKIVEVQSDIEEHEKQKI